MRTKLFATIAVLSLLIAALSMFGAALAEEASTDAVVNPAALARAGRSAEIEIRSVAGPSTFSGATSRSVIAESVTVPATQKNLLIIDFSATTRCFGAAEGICRVKVLIDSKPAQGGGTFTFMDSTEGGNSQSTAFESHALRRFSTCLTSGAHTVEVKASTAPTSVGQSAPTFQLNDAVLSIERLQGCQEATP